MAVFGQMLVLVEADPGAKVIVADADLVVSAALVAVTVTVWAEGMETGAVYAPADNDPTEGFRDQVTPVLLEPVTVAVNCAVWPLDRVAEEGVTLTATLAELVIVREPGVLVIDPVDPSISASIRFVICKAEEPVAVPATVAVIVATTPLARAFELKPARMHVSALQDNVFAEAEAAAPGCTVKETTLGGIFNVHWRAAVVPVPEANDRENDAMEPGAAIAEDTASIDAVAPKELEK